MTVEEEDAMLDAHFAIEDTQRQQQRHVS